MKHIQSFESYLNEAKLNEQGSVDESVNRWYDKMLDLGKNKIEFKWIDELVWVPIGVKDSIKKHLPGVNLKDLAVIFKQDAGYKWDKAKTIFGGVAGDDDSVGEFRITNVKSA